MKKKKKKMNSKDATDVFKKEKWEWIVIAVGQQMSEKSGH
jgi:hypothetical protein